MRSAPILSMPSLAPPSSTPSIQPYEQVWFDRSARRAKTAAAPKRKPDLVLGDDLADRWFKR